MFEKVLKPLVTFLGFFAATSGQKTKTYFSKQENNISGIATFPIDETLFKQDVFFDEHPHVAKDKENNKGKERIIKFGPAAEYRDFFAEEIFDPKELSRKYKKHPEAISNTIPLLEKGYFLKMPLYQFLSFIDVDDKKQVEIRCPNEDNKIILIEYVKPKENLETKGKINFFVADYYKGKGIKLKLIHSRNATQNQLKDILKSLADSQVTQDNPATGKADIYIPFNFELLNPKSGEIEEVQLNIIPDKEYGDYSLNQLKDMAASTSPELKKIVTNLNKLYRQMGQELKDNPPKMQILKEIKQTVIDVASAESTSELQQLASTLKKLSSSNNFNKLQFRSEEFKDILSYAKDSLKNIVSKLNALQIDKEVTLSPRRK